MYLVHLYKQDVAHKHYKIAQQNREIESSASKFRTDYNLDSSSYQHLNFELITIVRVNQGSAHVYYI
jgi:hypothetical protein